MRRGFLLLLCLAACFAVSAQVTSRLGKFQVDKIKGCAPFTISVIIPAGQCNPCFMDFEGKTPPVQFQNQFAFTYLTPGTYKLSVLFQGVGADDINVTVVQNIQPDFEIHACAGLGVSVKVTDNNYKQYVIDFNNDNIAEDTIPFSNNAVSQHTYDSSNNVGIAVRGRDNNVNTADNCAAKVQPFTPLSTLPPPTITAMTVPGATSAILDFSVQNNIQYRLEIAVNNATTFQVYQTLFGVNTITIPNLLTDNNYYCFRLGAYDPCANTNNYSPTVCSQDFNVAFQNGVNQLSWKTSTAGITSVTVERLEVVKNIQTSTNIPGAPLTFTDLDYDCNVDYCYNVVANYAGGVKSTSIQKCGTAILKTTHPPIDDVSSDVTGGVDLAWLGDPLIKNKEFHIWRSDQGNALGFLTSTANEQLTDASYFTAGAYCYQVNYTDQCQNPSADGIIACPIRLLGTMNGQNVVSLTWTRYTGLKNGVSNYTLEKFNKAGDLIQRYNMALDTFFVDDQQDLQNQVVSYRVYATSLQVRFPGTSFSNTLTFTKEINLIFPTAFTPNGDSLNDTFTIEGQFVAKMSVQVFDRWGALIFSSEEIPAWNGINNGQPMPESSYVWKAKITDLAGRTFSREGTLVLLRNSR